MLFIDVALFLPEQHEYELNWTVFKWLSMVHETSVPDMMDRLKGLKRKSLLEDLGDGRCVKIGMHDLWRELSVMETKAGEFESRCWVYEVKQSTALEESTPAWGFWHSVKRMCFLGKGLMNARRVNLDHFSNIIVLKLVSLLVSPVAPDVKTLKHLKSFEFDAEWGTRHGRIIEVNGLRLAEKLSYLKLRHAKLSAASVDDIGHLTNLRVLVLTHFKGERLPDLSKLISLEMVNFSYCAALVTVSGLSSRLSNLRTLILGYCRELRSLGPGVRDLVALQELSLPDCNKLDELPDLLKLTNLRILDISLCLKIKSLPGWGELIALQQLRAEGCCEFAELPDMCKISKLEVLDLKGCRSLMELTCTGLLIVLGRVDLGDSLSLKAIPDLSNFPKLKVLRLRNCESLMELTCTGPLAALEELDLDGCRSLDRIPDLSNFSRLNVLLLRDCESLMELTCTGSVAAPLTHTLDLFGCRSLKAIPDLSNFSRLNVLRLRSCESLMGLTCTGPPLH